MYVSRAKSYEFIFGYALAVLPIAFVQAILFFLVGGIFDASIFGVGILFGAICNEKSMGGVSSIIITGQSVLSGMWFPVEGLNQEMVTFVKVLPFKNSTLLIQNVVIGINDAFNDFWLPLITVVSYSVVIIIMAILTFRNKMIEK